LGENALKCHHNLGCSECFLEDIFEGWLVFKRFFILKFAQRLTLALSGLNPKSLRGKRFHKDHRYIAEKASFHFNKASIPIKMYLKSLEILEKASISLKSLEK
jgi:hypothetical protein